ncbi:MAG: TlyA family RNA methyltransferase [Christensenellales bacterium]|jgi:23S rRNA (cytidine1920-2'-O)/16S rRNA (cytidine1409-2'-O)-methyltransferase
MAKTVPLLQRLVEEGYFPDQKTAAAWVLGGKVYVNGQRARSGQRVDVQAMLSVPELALRYASRGGYKLEGALQAFDVDVRGRVCIDAGASTGGFTDCLLQHGAGKVYAVDVGFGQLTGTLRQDARVVNLERTNISDETLLSLCPRPTLGTCDLSYLSLTKAVPYYDRILGGQGELLCLVKPLFETSDAEAGRTGKMPDDAYAPLLKDLVHTLEQDNALSVRAVAASPVTGSGGTVEFFLHIALGTTEHRRNLHQDIDQSVLRALTLLHKEKDNTDV